MEPVKLDGHEVQFGQIRCHPFIKFGLREYLEAPGYGGFGQAAADLCRNTCLGQPNRTAKLARSDIHHHQVHGPLIEKSTRGNLFPSWQGHFLASGLAADPRSVHFNLAPVKPKPGFRGAPTIPRLLRAVLVASSGKPGHIFVHHLHQAFNTSRQAESLEAFGQRLKGLTDKRRTARSCRQSKGDVVVVFMVLLPFCFEYPEPTAQGKQHHPNSKFQH